MSPRKSFAGALNAVYLNFYVKQLKDKTQRTHLNIPLGLVLAHGQATVSSTGTPLLSSRCTSRQPSEAH